MHDLILGHAFFFFAPTMRIILSILLLITVSLYVLPVKEILKEQVCAGITDPVEKVEDGKKKEKQTDFVLQHPCQPFIQEHSLSLYITQHRNITSPLRDIEVPPPNQG